MVLGKGVFRFVSGSMRKSGVSLKTPTATIGIRGTDFVVAVGNDNSTSIEVFDGEVEVTPVNVSVPTVIGRGGSGTVGPAGDGVSRGGNGGNGAGRSGGAGGFGSFGGGASGSGGSAGGSSGGGGGGR